MGAAAIGVALFRDSMRFNPRDPLWLNRDRFVLYVCSRQLQRSFRADWILPCSSAGHACLFQYIMLHLVGYEAWTLNEVKRYHSRDFKTSKAAGHPEIEQEIGIEVTTGPLVSYKTLSVPSAPNSLFLALAQGQGIANAVGLAIANKQLATRYNKPDYEIVNNKIWCFTGDGCIQEGVGQEGEILSVAHSAI